MDFAPSQPAPQGAGLRVPSVGGIMSIRSLAQLQQEERRAAELVNAKPYITNLAAHIRTQWAAMKTAKLQTVEPRLLQCLRLPKAKKLQPLRRRASSCSTWSPTVFAWAASRERARWKPLKSRSSAAAAR